MKTISRRGILGCMAFPALSGCLDSVHRNKNDTIKLGNIKVSNLSEEESNITVRVEQKGDVLYEEHISLSQKDAKLISGEWPSEPSKYTLMFAYKGSIQHFDLPDDISTNGNKCADLDIQYAIDSVELFTYGENVSWGECSN